MDILDHHHGVAPLRDGVAGVDRGEAGAAEADRVALAGIGEIEEMDGDPVHRRGVVGGRRPQGGDRAGQDPAETVVDRDLLLRPAVEETGIGKGLVPDGPGLVQGFVVEVDITFHE